MHYKDKILLKQQVESAYKPMMIPIYKQWTQYSSVEIRLEVMRILNEHNHQKLMAMLNKRKYRKKGIKKIKEELDMLKVKKEEDNFVMELEKI